MKTKTKCILDRIGLTELIIQIGKGNDYARKMATNLNLLDGGSVIKQLHQLEKEGFIKSKREKLLNKKVYRLTSLGRRTNLFALRIKKEKRMFINSLNE